MATSGGEQEWGKRQGGKVRMGTKGVRIDQREMGPGKD